MALADAAERQGAYGIAAAELMAVADIAGADLGDAVAATAALERVLDLAAHPERARDGAAVHPSIAEAAAYALDRRHAGEPGYAKRLRDVTMPYRVALQNADLAAVITPHYEAYQTDSNPIAAYRAFADAHPRSFRAAYADYFGFVLALAFGGELGNAAALHDAFLERHPESLLALSVASYMLAYHDATGRRDEYARELERVRALGTRLGFSADVVSGSESTAAEPLDTPTTAATPGPPG
jgi:hypothetical protein